MEMASAAQLLRETLLERIGRNPSYSLRAFARQLGVSHTYLSLVMSGKKRLSLRKTLEFSNTLGLDEQSADRLLKAAVRSEVPARRSATSDFFVLEMDRFRLLSEWYHLAILDLTLLRTFKPDIRWIARKLAIQPQQARVAVDRLQRLGLLRIERNRWIKTNARITIPTSSSRKSVREFHSQMIRKALDQLTSSKGFDRRNITGTTIAVNPAKIAGAKRRIERFSKSLLAYLSDGALTELYQLNVQLFPLTQKEEER